MTIIKKLDLFVLKNFALIFAGSFFICLFVFMMQFTWRYVDELIGKGLSVDIFAQFFWYMALTLVPQALPLSILLASLIAFGNMGERLELLAMKAAGVPLIKIMRSVFILAITFVGISFYFQNVISPMAQRQFRVLLFSMKQTSPVLEIPEGVFFNGIPNVNLYVQKKDATTGMLYQIIIYKTDQGFDRAQIVLADSGKLEMTEDRNFLRLTLYNGEQFENLQAQNLNALQATVPYDRETFQNKQLLIEFDGNFDLMNANELNGMPQAKNMKQIELGIDSMQTLIDSIGDVYYKDANIIYYPKAKVTPQDSVKALRASTIPNINPDVLFDKLTGEKQLSIIQSALGDVQNIRSDLDWKRYNTEGTDAEIRGHWIEWHSKMTLALSCIIFFFVGAPLGAIIRKGGLGMPTVVSVGIFIIYYIINTSGMKMARDGSWNMVYGMWSSVMILTPLGLFLTYKANNDSVVFNMDLYTNFFRTILGLRTKRHIFRKEVIINESDYQLATKKLSELKEGCLTYAREKRILSAPNYIQTFFHYQQDHSIEQLSDQLEALVEELSNSRDFQILNELNNLPILFVRAHLSPFNRKWPNILAGILLPFGIILWFRIWRFRMRLYRDMKQVVSSCDIFNERIEQLKNK